MRNDMIVALESDSESDGSVHEAFSCSSDDEA